MKNIDYNLLLNEKYDITDSCQLLEKLIADSKYAAEKRLANFRKINADYIELLSMYSTLSEYHLLILGNYIDIKNKIIGLRNNPLFALFLKGRERNDLLGMLALHIYHFEEDGDIVTLLNKIRLELGNIMFYEAAYLSTLSYKESLPNDYLKSKAIDNNFLEQFLIETQLKKIRELEDDKFNHDDIYAKYVFKLGVVSLRVVFDFMTSYKLLDKSINFGKFAHMLQPGNDWVFEFNLRETDMTFEHLELLLNMLMLLYNGDKKEYQDFLIKKVKIISKHGNFRMGDEIELKMRKTLYKNLEKSQDIITKHINSLHKKIVSLEMVN